MSPLVVPASFVLGYLLGSVPFGLVVTRLFGARDPRTIGSGNIGATNVLRTGNKGLAALTLAGDMLKGTAAVLIGRYYGADAAMAAGVGAFLGHLFPLWLQFKGGKGVATYIGVALGLYWPAALIFAGVWLAVAAAMRLSSLSALMASLAAPLFAWWQGNAPLAGLLAFMTALLWFMHRANIKRLLNGTEPRIGRDS
jgi:glycerol-3-phosphate acyltransferase PlsY